MLQKAEGKSALVESYLFKHNIGTIWLVEQVCYFHVHKMHDYQMLLLFVLHGHMFPMRDIVF